jgi:hypothetical protein
MRNRKANSKHPKSRRYKVLHPSGHWESFRLPYYFTAGDLAARLVYALVFVQIPPTGFVMVGGRRCDGPCWALYSDRAKAFTLADCRNPELLSDAELAAAC